MNYNYTLIYRQCRNVTKIYSKRRHKFAVSPRWIAKHRIAAQSRAEARTRSRLNAGRWKIRDDEREARRRVERGRRVRNGTRTCAANAGIG